MKAEKDVLASLITALKKPEIKTVEEVEKYFTDSKDGVITKYTLEAEKNKWIVLEKDSRDIKEIFYEIKNLTREEIEKKLTKAKAQKAPQENKISIDNVDDFQNQMKTKDDNIYDITIDPGHGGMDSGAVVDKKEEKDYTMAISTKIKNNLEKNGIKIYKSIILRNMLKIYIKVKKIFKGEKLVTNGLKREYNVALHGCFLIFSKRYYKKYKDIFFNETFLYHEEEFIYQRIVKDKLISIYDPKLKVFHKEGASLNSTIKEEYPKLIFKNKEILKSLELLEKEMRK